MFGEKDAAFRVWKKLVVVASSIDLATYKAMISTCLIELPLITLLYFVL